ncbi:MAG: DnaJ C-terminal domain-containing protein [Paracoccus sp. (in: a-proteobacteria)]|nr:DnaJ C-terminal domain-containing protein [Paracoccus sp. (in: a-proteobacteria)]
MDDPYKALGVAKTASQDEIKKAYRRIAKTDHPDLNSDPAATERFKAASSAYDLLKDPEQRARFDRGEIDAGGREKPNPRFYRDYAARGDNPYRNTQHGDFGEFSDIFSDLFGAGAEARGRSRGGASRGAQAQGFGAGPGFDDLNLRGPDHRFELEIGFMTAAKGGTTRITLPSGDSLEVKIPEGARDGQTIRLRGKGGPGYGQGGPGDALLTLHVADDPDWTREGDDIRRILPITLDQAILGGKVEAQTIGGPVAVSVPKGAQTGQRLRLKGRGIKGGDHYAELRVVMPPTIDDELARFMEEWRKTNSYEPDRRRPT